MANVLAGIPSGTLKILNISEIKCEARFRLDLGDLDTLVESIKEKGILQPITVDSNMKLLAGGRRLTASKKAGLTKIPALVRKSSDDIDALEVELFENIHRKDFDWAEEAACVAKIDSLYKAKNVDWSGRKTAQLLNRGVASVARALQLNKAIQNIPEIGTLKTADDALKAIKGLEEQAIVHELRKRQVDPENTSIDKGIAAMLRLAEANYKIGDTFKGMAELRSDGIINLIECDPPYGINLTQVKASKDSVSSNVHSYNEVSKDDYPVFLQKLTKELYRVAGQHCWLVFWFGPTWQSEVLKALRDAGWQTDEIPAIWVKRQGQTLQPEMYLARGYEPFYLARKGVPAMAHRGRLNVFEHPGVAGVLKYHPTERPVELIEDILETLTVPGSVVFVPFLGSGATIRAAYNSGMKVFGYDMNPEYKDKFMLAIEKDARSLNKEDSEAE